VKRAAGFTLVELVVVLILLGIVAAVGGARFFDLQTYRTRAWIDQITVTTSYARAMAIANRGQKVRLVYDSGTISAALAADCSTATTTPLANPSGNGVLNLSAPDGVTLAVSGQTLPYGICLDSLGRPRDTASAAGALLTGITTLQVTGAGGTTPIYLEPETGFVHL